jgi:pectate lyase
MQKRFALVAVIMVFLMITLFAGCGGGSSSSSGSSSSPANKNQIVITPSYTADATASAIAVRYANAYRISGAKLATATVPNQTVKLLTCDPGITATTSSDGITLIKIDHCELWNWADAIETNPSDATKDRYDELISLKNNAQGVILAWNYLHGSYKTILVGSNDDADALADRKLIMHHNYINNCGSRLSLYRGGYAHIYNNYFVGVTGSGINCRSGAHLKITQNYFLNCKNPIGYFYDDNRSETGYWDVDANSYSGCRGACPTASTCTVTFESGYTPAVDAAAAVSGKVKAGAGVGK